MVSTTTSRGHLLNWLTIHKLPKAGLILFHLGLPPTTGTFSFFYLGLPLTASSFHFSSGLTSNGQFSSFSYLGLPLTASSLHFHIWAYLSIASQTPFLSGLTSNGQFSPFSFGLTSNGQLSLFSCLGLPLTASSLHFHI